MRIQILGASLYLTMQVLAQNDGPASHRLIPINMAKADLGMIIKTNHLPTNRHAFKWRGNLGNEFAPVPLQQHFGMPIKRPSPGTNYTLKVFPPNPATNYTMKIIP